MNPDYLRELINDAGVSIHEAAAAIGISRRAMMYYLSGEREAPQPVVFSLENLKKILKKSRK